MKQILFLGVASLLAVGSTGVAEAQGITVNNYKYLQPQTVASEQIQKEGETPAGALIWEDFSKFQPEVKNSRTAKSLVKKTG